MGKSHLVWLKWIEKGLQKSSLDDSKSGTKTKVNVEEVLLLDCLDAKSKQRLRLCELSLCYLIETSGTPLHFMCANMWNTACSNCNCII